MLFEHILVTTDMSEASRAAFDLALYMAKMSNSRITLLSVFEPFSVPPLLRAELQDTEKFERMTREHEAAKRAELDQLIKDYFHRQDVTPQVIFSNKPPAEEIVKFAHDDFVNLIVIATHGRGALGNFFMGSVTQRVIHEVECPVLVIPKVEP